MSQNRQSKALVFDAYGTLFDVHSVVAACEELFPGRGAAVSQMWRSKQLEYSWLSSLMGRYEDFWKLTESAFLFTCRALRLTCDSAARARLMEAYLHLEPFPEVRQALKALADRPLAILSNGSPRMLQEVVKNVGLEGTFSHVISVNEVKIYKPSPRVYGLAPTKLGVDKSAIGFVSSNFWDAIGAKNFGFRTYWVNRSGSPPEELGLSPDRMVSTLAELPGIV